MIREKVEGDGPIVIDLTGADGNAFVLMGYARRFGQQIGYTHDKIGDVLKEMQSGDYENLLNVFDSHFGTYVILER